MALADHDHDHDHEYMVPDMVPGVVPDMVPGVVPASRLVWQRE
jgi:hypothetical protein